MTKARIINLLPEVGIAIFFSSFFLPWFYCLSTSFGDTGVVGYMNIGYPLHFYPSCFAFLIYLFTKLSRKNDFLSFSFVVLLFTLFFIFLSLLLIGLAGVSVHQTVDIPCAYGPGFWLNVLGFVAVLIGIFFRTLQDME
jgi:hypothetical protein